MSGIDFTILWSDALFGILLAVVTTGIVLALRQPHVRRAWQNVFAARGAMIAATILLPVLVITLLDSLHFRRALESSGKADKTYYAVDVLSVFDVVAGPLHDHREQTYSAPFAWLLYEKQPIPQPDGTQIRDYPRLVYGGAHLTDPAAQRAGDIANTTMRGLLLGLGGWTVLVAIAGGVASWRERIPWVTAVRRLMRGETVLAWHAMAWTLLVLAVIFGPLCALSGRYHVFGTDQVGNDVFFSALKSLRTALLIGTLATLVVLPLGVGLGVAAGYFGGWVDDVIQYIYTVISSIPYVLLIAAAVLLVQVAVETHPDIFNTPAARADARLVSLCLIIGAISWTSLCRLIRAETLKLRELDYVQAARCFGVSNFRIMWRHVLPNAFHLVLINTAIEFSYLVLAEAVLSFVGVGVDPSTISFGTMINSARSELAREPMVWWSIVTAFIFMVSLVLAANLLADAIRDAFDPRAPVSARRLRLRRLRSTA